MVQIQGHFSVCLCGFRINHTVILDDPFDDPAGLPVPDRSPEPTKEQLDVSVSFSNTESCEICQPRAGVCNELACRVRYE